MTQISSRPGWTGLLLRLCLALWLLAGFVAGVSAQSLASGPEPVMVSPTEDTVSLAGRFGHLVDPEGQLTLAEVRQLQREGWFTVDRRGALSAGLLPLGAVWVHFRLAGPVPLQAGWWLDAGDAVLDRVTVFIEQPDGGFQVREGGRAVDFAEREWVWNRHAFALESASAAPVDVYIRYASLAVLRIDPRLARRTELERSRDQSALFFGAFFGVMGLALVASAVRWAWFRSVPDAWYACYVGSLQMFDLAHSGLAPVLGVARSLGAVHTMQTLGVMLAGIFLMVFARSLIQWPEHWTRMADRAIAAFAAFYLVGYGWLHVQAPQWLFVYIVVFSGVSLVSCLLGAGVAWARGLPNARTFMLAFAPFIVVASMRLLHTVGWIDQGSPVMHLFHATTMLHALLLMVAILVREEGTRRARNLLAWEVQHLNQDLSNQTLFLRMLAHEVRNPLAVIDGHSQLLMRRSSTPAEDSHRLLEGIRGSVARLSELIDRLLSQDRLARPAALERKPLDLNAVVEQVIAQVQRETDQHLIRLRAEASPLRVVGDARLLAVLVSNLLENAVRYSPDGGAIAVRTGLSPDGRAELSVSDEGVGISPEALERIFERYYRTGQVPDAVGAGLGLYLVRSIAEMHGGEVRCHSVLGEGSTFSVSLPLR